MAPARETRRGLPDAQVGALAERAVGRLLVVDNGRGQPRVWRRVDVLNRSARAPPALRHVLVDVERLPAGYARGWATNHQQAA